MRVIVFGATSRLGRQIWRKALDDGHEVTVFGRWVKQLNKKEPALRTIRGDSFDARAMSGAISRHDAVIVSLGTDLIEQTAPSTATKIIVDAMVERDVKRLVVATTTNHGLDEKEISMAARIFYPFFRMWGFRAGTHLLDTMSGHAPQEAIIKDSPLDWTIVRVPVINDKLAPGFVERTTNVSREDGATFLVKQLGDPSNIHRTITARSSDASLADESPTDDPPPKGKFDDYPL